MFNVEHQGKKSKFNTPVTAQAHAYITTVSVTRQWVTRDDVLELLLVSHARELSRVRVSARRGRARRQRPILEFAHLLRVVGVVQAWGGVRESRPWRKEHCRVFICAVRSASVRMPIGSAEIRGGIFFRGRVSDGCESPTDCGELAQAQTIPGGRPPP